VREEVARFVHHLDPLLAIGDPDVDVQPEDEELADDVLQLLLEHLVALVLGDELVLPVRERMRAGGHQAEAVALQQRCERPPSVRDLVARLADVGADPSPDLDDGLHHLGLHALLEVRLRRADEQFAVALQLAIAVDDLELLLDPDGQPLDVALHCSTSRLRREWPGAGGLARRGEAARRSIFISRRYRSAQRCPPRR